MFRKLSLCSTLIVVSACAGPDDKFGSFWEAPRYYSAIVSMPNNAPSMRNRFYYPVSDTEDDSGGHFGIDIIGELGASVLAPADGVVKKVFIEPFYGRNILISHGFDAAGDEIFTSFWHLNSQHVAVGDVVKRGQVIGGLGRSGVLAAGILHLHFQFMKKSGRNVPEPVDPNLYWVGGAGIVTCFDPEQDWSETPLRLTYPVLCK